MVDRNDTAYGEGTWNLKASQEVVEEPTKNDKVAPRNMVQEIPILHKVQVTRRTNIEAQDEG